MKGPLSIFALPARYHFYGSLAIVILVCVTISSQMMRRQNFADSELHHDVMERWGAPIVQPAPSVRYVPSGAVFNNLAALPLRSQEVVVDAAMNYRKRGLVYFSGFDFSFRGDYVVENQEGRDIDIAFVFPINLEKNKVLLKNLLFTVDGKPVRTELDSGADKLLWTGRLRDGERIAFQVAFFGRGLENFTYTLDPAAPVRNLRLAMHITGGANFDYLDGVVPASSARTKGEEVWLEWNYPSLQSGIPVGVILPAEKSYDHLISTMVRRAWAPFLLFFAGLSALCIYQRRQLRIYESYLIAAAYGLFFVLLAYLAAFMSFYPAWGISLGITFLLLYTYLRFVLSSSAGRYVLGLLLSSLCVPTAAVFLEGYTGLIYTMELLALITTMMVLTTRPTVRALIEELTRPAKVEGEAHAA